MAASAVAINVSAIILIYVLIMIIATVFVYKDARKRNMNGGLWGVVAFFGPFLIGVIIYLVCRNPITDLQCSKCGASVEKKDKSCPKCGAGLLINCPKCEFPVQKGWQSCPKCGERFPEDFSQPIKKYKKESGVGIIVLIVILAVVCLGFVACALFGSASYSYTGYSYSGMQVGIYNITAEDLSKNNEIKSWIEKSDKSKKDIHVLYSKQDNTCLVYIKDSEYLLTSDSFEFNYTPDGADCLVYINETPYEDKYGYDFYCYNIKESAENIDVKVFFNGSEEKAEVTVTDKDISVDTWEVE